MKDARELAVPLRLLGINEPMRVRDLWSGTELGTMRTRIAARIPGHGAGLYRLSAVS
jgi:hypothetical protein